MNRDHSFKARKVAKIGMHILGVILGALLTYVGAIVIGFGAREGIGIAAAGSVLAAASVALPWGGFLFPSDSLLISLCLITGNPSVGIVAVGLTLISHIATGWRRAWYVAASRIVTSVAVIGLWHTLVPRWWIIVREGQVFSSLRGFYVNKLWMTSAEAVPSLLLTSLAFVVVTSIMGTLLRSRKEYRFGEYWLLNYGRCLHHFILTLTLGAIMAVVYREIGIASFVLFAFPVLLTRDALKRGLDLRLSRTEALRALSSSVDARDRYTHEHSDRVARLAGKLARRMGFPESTVEIIESGALLHDIGKISVDTAILGKPGPLNEEEMKVIRQHPVQSAQIISRINLLRGAMEVVRQHHERPDGKGYPDGLRGHEICVGARILNVVDAFDAMISDRPYRKRKSIEQALEELRKGAGKEFDPVVVEYLSRMIEEEGRELLDTGTISVAPV